MDSINHAEASTLEILKKFSKMKGKTLVINNYHPKLKK